MSRINRLRLLSCCFIIIMMNNHFIHGVSFDYYYGSLRSKKTCNNLTAKVNCQIKCGVDTGLCIGNDCYCLSVSRLKEYGIKGFRDIPRKLLKQQENEHSYSDFQDYNEERDIVTERRNEDPTHEAPEYLDVTLLQDKPVLRHHIAHFCPNLDVARTCIRTCMKEGKPAFCGKDHVCYCGHKYSNNDRNPKTNVSNVYAEFHDLYQKYFGPNYKQQIEV